MKRFLSRIVALPLLLATATVVWDALSTHKPGVPPPAAGIDQGRSHESALPRSAESPANAAAATVPHPQLIGVIVAQRKEDSIALLSLPNQEAATVHDGDSLAGWRVVRIESNGVELERDGVSLRVRLAGPADGQSPVATQSSSRPSGYPGAHVIGQFGAD